MKPLLFFFFVYYIIVCNYYTHHGKTNLCYNHTSIIPYTCTCLRRVVKKNVNLNSKMKFSNLLRNYFNVSPVSTHPIEYWRLCKNQTIPKSCRDFVIEIGFCQSITWVRTVLCCGHRDVGDNKSYHLFPDIGKFNPNRI